MQQISLWLIGCYLLLSGAEVAHAASAPSQPAVRQLWQLLDYIAVDYVGAVANGAVASESEYAEMREFSDNAVKGTQALAPSASKDGLVVLALRLQQAVMGKAAASEVAALARRATGELLTAYPIPVAPKSVPDLQRGATLYQAQCLSCHGAEGRADGPLAANLTPPPIAFSDPDRARVRSVLALYQVVSQGVSGTSMIGFGRLPEADRWALAFYIGTLSHDDAMRAHGGELWASDRSLRAKLTDLSVLTTSTEITLAGGMQASDARDLMAYLRSHPNVIQVTQASGPRRARERLQESVVAMRAGDRTDATRLALSAYLEEFEPLEPMLGARNKPLLIQVESTMMAFRAAISKDNIDQAVAAESRLEQLLEQVDQELGPRHVDAETTFAGALTIVLREGIEALLVVVGMIAFLRKAGRNEVLHYVHTGWVSALAAGGLTWVAATYVVSISGASREMTEGVSSVFASVVLLGVGLWMHQKSAAGRWQIYLNDKLSAAMSRRSAFALFVLAFVAVYREVFETVLFYAALWVDGSGNALLAGLLSGVVVLVVIAWVLLSTSARMPISKFFSISALLVAALAVILVGKGVASLQEAGVLSASLLALPRIEVLGVYPSIETVLAQVVVLGVALVGFGLNVVAGRRSQTRQLRPG